jgi:hypothetical protein
VIGYVPAAVVAEVVTVRVDEAPDVTDAGLNETVDPAGPPVADNATDSAEPDVTAVDTVEVAVPPAAGTEPDEGEADSEKSSPTVVLLVILLKMFE